MFKSSQVGALILIQFLAVQSIPAQRHKSSRTAGLTERSREKAKEVPAAGLPFKIEVGLSSDPQQVVLAVDAVTAFHCPEPVLQVIFGNNSGIGLAESVEGTPRSDFYLRPTQTDISTNIFIEMKSATVTLQLRTIRIPGGPRLGAYNGEVFVRLPGYHDELAQSKTIINALQTDLAACAAERESMKQRSARAEAQAIADTEDAIVKESLHALADLPQKPTGRTIDTPTVRVAQVAPAVRSRSGRVWAVIEIANHSKNEAISIKSVAAAGYGQVLTSFETIRPHGKARLPIVAIPSTADESQVSESHFPALPTMAITFSRGAPLSYPLQ